MVDVANNRIAFSTVARLYSEGVAAVVAAARSSPMSAAPVCGEWTATDLIRHLFVVVGWYDDWLDRALVGNAAPPFLASEFAERNRAALSVLDADLVGDGAVERFESAARAYLDRASEHLDVAYGFPFGTITVLQHLGAAAGEWHLHAWDLDRSYTPSNPGGLFVAVASAMAATKSGPKRWLLARLIPLVAKRSPWTTLLRRSGRGGQ